MKVKRYMALALALAALTALSRCGRQELPPLRGESTMSTANSHTQALPYDSVPDESTADESTAAWAETSSAERSGEQNSSAPAQSSSASRVSNSSTARVSTTKRVATTAAKGENGGKGAYPYDYPGIHPAAAVFKEDEWYLLLVNRDFALPEGFKPQTAVCLPGVYEENRELDARVAPIYREMYYAALQDGIELVPYSGYRRHSTQKSNFEKKVASYRNQGYSNAEAVNLAARIVLPPGCSEHEAGLAMDIVRPGVWELQVSFENSKQFAWLSEHAADYGFILRYAKDKQDVTKITYEPWHWRYVGAEAAKEIKEREVCLEEYLGVVG